MHIEEEDLKVDSSPAASGDGFLSPSGEAQAKLAGQAESGAQIDSTMPRGEEAKALLDRMRQEIENTEDMAKRSNAYFELARYAKTVGEKELSKEYVSLAGQAEQAYRFILKERDQKVAEKIKMQIAAYLSGDATSLDILNDASPRLHSMPSAGEHKVVKMNGEETNESEIQHFGAA
jgi:hypothetical protein